MNSINLKTIKNIRDLSYLKTDDGFNIKNKRIIRSGTLSDASEDDMYFLYVNYDLRTIVDLRSYSEKYEMPDTIIQDMEFIGITLQKDSYVGVTYDEESKRKLKEYFDKLDNECKNEEFAKQHMCDFYYSVGYNDATLEGFKEVFKVLLDKENCILFHCSLGRDRAGMLCAVILKVLGFSDYVIFEDYLNTNNYLKLDNVVSYNYSHALREYIESFFKGINDKYGSFNEFLKHIGINYNIVKELKNKYLERK